MSYNESGGARWHPCHWADNTADEILDWHLTGSFVYSMIYCITGYFTAVNLYKLIWKVSILIFNVIISFGYERECVHIEVPGNLTGFLFSINFIFKTPM